MGFPPDSSAHTDTNMAFPVPDISAKYGRDRSVNAGGNVEQTNGRTNPN